MMKPRSFWPLLLGTLFSCGVRPCFSVTCNVRNAGNSDPTGQIFTFYIKNPYTLIATAAADGAGNVTFDDTISQGQLRCIEVTPQPRNTYINNSGQYPGERVCANSFGAANFIGSFFGSFGAAAPATIFGGANGYVNPDLNETFNIVLIPPEAGEVTVRFYTLRGRLIATRVKTASPSIGTTIEWDCKDSSQKIVSTGAYLVHVSGAGINYKTKIAIVRN